MYETSVKLETTTTKQLATTYEYTKGRQENTVMQTTGMKRSRTPKENK
jgi:hypothetical protein